MDSTVKVNYADIDVALDYDPNGDQTFGGLDRFGRVLDQHWEETTTPTTLDRYQHGYDRASNRLYRENTLTTGLDELYAYDGLHRLTSMQRGDLNGTKDELTGTVARAEDWTLDHLGNWAEYAVALSGSVELAQERLHNTANEITQIAETTGSSWVDPAHDAAGNMTLLPKPGEPDEGFEAIYDAWNRLVKLIDADTEDTVAEYEWDGLGWRIVKKTYTGQTLDETRHFYYTEAHQIVEERVDGTSSADARIQYVWDIRYIDALVLRDRDMDDDGDLSDERLYALQDAQFNVTALVNDSSAVVERYSYTPYGERTVLNANWTEHSNPSEGSYSFAISFQGLMRDAETGLIYNRARMLHPAVGRFMQRDPLEYPDGMNLYAAYHVMWGWMDPLGFQVGPTFDGPTEPRYPVPSDPPSRPKKKRGFRWHGHWGGPGWVSGQWRPESGYIPKPGDDDYTAPVDDQDKCYEQHDRCINKADKRGQCPRLSESDWNEGCDQELADCLGNLKNKSLKSRFASGLFKTIVPWWVH